MYACDLPLTGHSGQGGIGARGRNRRLDGGPGGGPRGGYAGEHSGNHDRAERLVVKRVLRHLRAVARSLVADYRPG